MVLLSAGKVDAGYVGSPDVRACRVVVVRVLSVYTPRMLRVVVERGRWLLQCCMVALASCACKHTLAGQFVV